MYNLDILEQGKKVLEIEAEAINDLRNSLDEGFVKAVNFLGEVSGRVFISGVGKSGLIGRKIAATLSSTGTPAIFVHPTESFHGDIGVVSEGDVGILISYSGETEEILQIIPLLKRLGIKIVSITGNKDSTLAKHSDLTLLAPVKTEACPMGIVPTASTTATLALGDALAVALLIKKGFNAQDFAKLHPGGRLGRRLLIRVRDIMHTYPNLPLVRDNVSMKEALIEMTSKSLGVTGIINEKGELSGILTDGDLRRYIEKSGNFSVDIVKNFMIKNPKTIDGDELAVDALNMMEQHKITHIFVISKNEWSNKNTNVEGLLHIHNILGAKIL
jgi:arabinose-5-phosphate isomerase